MSNLLNFSEGLVQRQGIFFSDKESVVSYPEEGNENLFHIEDDSFWFRHRNNCILKAVQQFAPEKVFFDIGGGNGYVAKNLEQNGIETVLIEPGIQGCINARKRGLSTIICSTLENTDLHDNSIPGIGLFDVVEHIENDVEFLKLVNRYLMPEGLVFLTVPAYQFLWSEEDVYAGHYKRYTLSKITDSLKDAGFCIEYSTYIFSLLPLPIFFFRTIPSAIGMARKSNDLKKYTKDHKSKNKIIDSVLNKLFQYELDAIENRKQISFGGSCLVVAKKI